MLQGEVRNLEISLAQTRAQLQDMSTRYNVHTHPLSFGLSSIPILNCTASNLIGTINHVCASTQDSITVLLWTGGSQMQTGPPKM